MKVQVSHMRILPALLQPHEGENLRLHLSFPCTDGFRVTVFICDVCLEKSSYCLIIVSVFLGCLFPGSLAREQAPLSAPAVSGLLASLTLIGMSKKKTQKTHCCVVPWVLRSLDKLTSFHLSEFLYVSFIYKSF